MQITIEIADEVIDGIIQEMHHSKDSTIDCLFVANEIEELAKQELSNIDWVDKAEQAILN